MNKGKITQVIGPVVDVVFEGDPLPLIKEEMCIRDRIIWEENTFAQRDARIFRAASYGRPGCSRPQNGEYR